MPQSPWLALSAALQKAIDAVVANTESEMVNTRVALGRIVSKAIVAPVSVPPWDNSAMDGYAVNTEQALLGTVLPVSQTLTAGMAADTPLSPNSAARIMTGAQIPTGANAVVMQENTEISGSKVVIKQAATEGENIRVCGADISKDSIVVEAGTRLTASHLMLISSLGLAEVEVYKKLKIGVLATGDELAAPGTQASPEQIYEANRTGVSALLAPLAVDVHDYGIAKDDPQVIRELFQKAAREVDMLISSGGVSVGDADFVKDVLQDLGEIEFWKVAIKPGKPFAFGIVGNTYFCGLPGNPVSAYVTTEQIVMPLLRHLQGETIDPDSHRMTLNATVTKTFKRRPGRKEFLRALWHRDDEGKLWVTPFKKQSSGVMSTVTQANCYLILEAETSVIVPGDTVDIQPFTMLL